MPLLPSPRALHQPLHLLQFWSPNLQVNILERGEYAPPLKQGMGVYTVKKITLNKADKKLMGVCAGLADWSNLDVTLIRLLFVIAAICGVGAPVLIYIILALVLD